MPENTEQKREITIGHVMNQLMEMHEVVAAMKQCNPNMNPIKAFVFSRWRDILWDGLPIIKEYIENIQQPVLPFKDKPILFKAQRVKVKK